MKSSVTRLALITALLAIPATTSAQFSSGEPGFAKEGGYAGMSLMPKFTFDRVTFDGEGIYKEIGGDEITILPRLSTQTMVRVILGYRAKKAGLEVSYDFTNHDGTFLEGSGKATFRSLNLDGRYFFMPNQRIQPYMQVGGSMPSFTVKEGSFLHDAVADAKFSGYGVNAEGGVVIYPQRQLGVSVGYNYRVLSFDKVTGVKDRLFNLRPRFRETSGTVVLSGHYIF
jgi:hypothetical protein